MLIYYQKGLKRWPFNLCSTVIITDDDTSGNLDYWYQYAGTGTWHQQQVASASRPAASSPSGTTR